MKLETQKLEIIFVILVIFTICSILTQNQTSNSGEQCFQDEIQENTKDHSIDNIINLRASATWNLNYIEINPLGGNGSWSWAATQLWWSGSGIWGGAICN